MEPFIRLHSLRITVVTWNVNAKIETNILALRTQLLGLPGRVFSPMKGEVHRNPMFNANASMECIPVDPENLPDIVVVGLQEIIELNTSNVLGGSVTGQSSSDQLSTWQSNIEKALNHHLLDRWGSDDEHEYLLLAKQSMVGLGVLVFTLKPLRSLIQHVQVSSLARGVGGMLGNKGAVYVRFRVLDSSICIVNAHFTAHREHVAKRNSDFWAIMTYPAFPDYLTLHTRALDQQATDSTAVSVMRSSLKSLQKKIQTLQALPVEASSSYYSLGAGLSAGGRLEYSVPTLTASSGAASGGLGAGTAIGAGACATATPLSPAPSSTSLLPMQNEMTYLAAEDHDVILWLGDLNYRIVQSMHINTVYKLIDNSNVPLLADFDQLTIEKDQGNIFPNFNEGLLTFNPTYQYVPGSPLYARESKKQRVPAWCDRILWRTGKPLVAATPLPATATPASEARGRRTEMEARRASARLSKQNPADLYADIPHMSAEEEAAFLHTVHDDSDDESVEDRESADRGDADGDVDNDGGTDEQVDNEMFQDLRRNSVYIKRASRALHDLLAGVDFSDLGLLDERVLDLVDDLVPDSTADGEGADDEGVGPGTATTRQTSLFSTAATEAESDAAALEDEDEAELLATGDEVSDVNPFASLPLPRSTSSDPLSSTGERQAQAVSERVELMQYTSVDALCLSDHKPVRAVLNVKVKCMDWQQYEQQLLAKMRPLLYDPMHGSFAQTLARVSFCTTSPRSVALQSLTNRGDRQVLTLTNTHPSCVLHFHVSSSDCEDWLLVSPVKGSIAPGQRQELAIFDCHAESTLKLVQEVEAFGAFDAPHLPTLSKHLTLPPNVRHMTISAILAILVKYTDAGGLGAGAPELAHVPVAEELLVPVVCALSL